MPDYISRKRLKKIALDRWENEGGKISTDQTDLPGELTSSKQISEKNSSQILRGGHRNDI